MRTRIKICGITNPEIAKQAMSAGADALGLMFYPKSSRYITIEQAIEINQIVSPFVTQVGVFANPDIKFINEILNAIHLDCLQFHGDESPEYCASFEIPYIKAVRVSETLDLLEVEENYNNAAALLLDSYVKGSYGGTGESFQWQRARYGGQLPIILAGGLRPDNVQQAIAEVSPYGVDTSSGVETDGKKDNKKIIDFCRNVVDSFKNK